MHIPDTDTLTHLHAGNPKVIENLKQLDDSDVRISIITIIELLRGRFEFLLKASDKMKHTPYPKIIPYFFMRLLCVLQVYLDFFSATI